MTPEPIDFKAKPLLDPDAVATWVRMDGLFNRVAGALHKEYAHITEEAFTECVRQACASGDFLKHVSHDHRVGFSYVPFREVSALRERVAAAEARLGRTCQWSGDEDGNWDAACGGCFTFMDGGPTENKVRFCPYCGGELVAVPYTQNDRTLATQPAPQDSDSK